VSSLFQREAGGSISKGSGRLGNLQAVDDPPAFLLEERTGGIIADEQALNNDEIVLVLSRNKRSVRECQPAVEQRPVRLRSGLR
jgi:hypothetical protein